MKSQVCVDASFVVKLGLPEEGSDRAESLWREWHRQGKAVTAPPLLCYEITSVLRNAVYRGRITQEEGLQILEYLLALSIRFLAPEKMHLNAWQIATSLRQPAAYDAHYLALAQNIGCDLWTGDKRLHQKVKEKMPWVKLVQEA